MERIELLEQLSERFDALPEEVRSAALALVETDPEIQQAVLFSKALVTNRTAEFYAAPQTSDAEFLIAVRKRIERVPSRPKSMFITGQRLAVVASACVVMLVAVIAGGRFAIMPAGEEPMAADEPLSVSERRMVPMMAMSRSVAAVNETVPLPLDSLTNADVDPLELAEYLNVGELAEQTLSTTDDSLPLTDELLALDAGTLEEVLSELEQTHFF